MKINKILLTLIFMFITSIINAKEIDFYNAKFYKGDIDSQTAYKMQQEDSIIIDIRTKNEFKNGRAKDSINIPLFYEKNKKRVFNKDFLTQIYLEVNKNVEKKIILICRSGSRTKLGSNLLAYNGFQNVYNIKKGFQYDWSKTKLPVEK